MSLGAYTATVPIYFYEVSPESKKKFYGSSLTIWFNLGVILAQLIGLEQVFGNSNWWLILILRIHPGKAQNGLKSVPPLCHTRPRLFSVTMAKLKISKYLGIVSIFVKPLGKDIPKKSSESRECRVLEVDFCLNFAVLYFCC